MALSGVFQGTAYNNNFIYKATWNATQNVSTNTSVVTITHTITTSQYASISVGNRNNTSKVGSNTINFTSPNISLGNSQTATLGTTRHTVTHNDEGEASVSFNGAFNCNFTLYNGTYIEKITASGTINLNDIARASGIDSVTANVSVNGTNACTVAIDRKSSSFTHSVKYSIGSYSHTATNVTTSNSYVIPRTWLNAIPNDTVGTARVTVTTYNGNTVIGSAVEKTFKISILSTDKPSGSVSTELVDGFNGNYIQSISKANVSVSASAGYGATIKYYSVSSPQFSFSSNSATATSGVIGASGTVEFVATVTDSRGISTTLSASTINVLAYTPPKILAGNNYALRINDDSTLVKLKANIGVTDISGNDLMLQYTLDNNLAVDFENNVEIIVENVSLENGGKIVVSYSDEISGNVYEIPYTIPTQTFPIDIHQSVNGISFGKTAEEEGVADFNYIGKFRKEVIAYEDIYARGGSVCNGLISSSVVVTSTNANPSSQYGGTWELIGKGWINNSISKTYTSSNATVGVVGVISDDCIRFRFTVTPNSSLSAVGTALCKVNLADFGLTSDFAYGVLTVPFNSQSNKSIGFLALSSTGFLTLGNITQSSLIPSSVGYASVNINTVYERKLDSFCDKFYWKKIG